MNKFEEYKASFETLVMTGDKMITEFHLRHRDDGKNEEDSAINIENYYQGWYTEAFLVMKQLLPDRLDEFVHLYEGDGQRNGIDYNIQDWLNGIRASSNRYSGEKSFDDSTIVLTRLISQLDILKSVKVRFDSILANIKQLAHADLFDSELDAAEELAHKEFLRAAGTVAGVVLEGHLRQVCDNHNIKMKEQRPTIGYLNDILKKHEVVDMPLFAKISALAAIRNICTHDKEREPVKGEVDELIQGVAKITHKLF